jgi:hypothetical protein
VILDLVSLLTGSGTTAIGIVLGVWIKGRHLDNAKSYCSCKHGAGSHDPDDGHCRAQINRPKKWDKDGEPVGFEWVPCPCLTNDGPEPLAVIEARVARYRMGLDEIAARVPREEGTGG